MTRRRFRSRYVAPLWWGWFAETILPAFLLFALLCALTLAAGMGGTL